MKGDVYKVCQISPGKSTAGKELGSGVLTEQVSSGVPFKHFVQLKLEGGRRKYVYKLLI